MAHEHGWYAINQLASLIFEGEDASP